jgi:hypothetical protein
MRRSASASAAFALALAAAGGCAGRVPAAGRESPAVIVAGASASPDTDAAGARNAVAAFLDAEAQGSSAADTLLAAEADFIMTGILAHARPRLAGLNGPGAATIEEANTSVAGAMAWVVVSYRFEGRTPDLSERGRATFVLEKQRAGWKIRHAHSSMVERW